MLRITDIKIENLRENCVTDVAPNISFALASDRQGESLAKAKISCGSWQVTTSDQINNLYTGELKPFTQYKVLIEAIGTSGETASAEATFQTGRLDTLWTARWITDGTYDFPDQVSPKPMTFRYEFSPARPIRRAWINSTALGVYELMLNNRKVGSDYFAPGLTSYEHQIQYQTYDVTEMISCDSGSNSNTLIAVVAGGWAAGSFNYKRKNKISADRQALLLELHIEYQNGTSEIIATDESWQVTEDGNYQMAEWYDGETYDATIDLNTINWKKCTITKPRGNPKLISQYGSPVRVQGKLHPVSCQRAPSGELIYDFGQNFAGVIFAEILAKASQAVMFRHAEVLVDGELFVKSLRTAKATAICHCKDDVQQYSPRLTYMGFRYVGVSLKNGGQISPDDIKLSALVLHSDIEEIGKFECSNPLVNQLQSNIRWGGKSNFVDIPTDCPQRDERQGWTGDISVFASTACYNFDMSRFFDKWLLDMRAEQSRGGGIPMVVPRAGDSWPVMANSCWGDSCVLVPWAEYLARGNKSLLKKQYPTIKKFLKAAKWWAGLFSIGPNSRYIWRFPFHFGDWCAPDENVKQWLAKGKWVGTAYFANSCNITAQIAEIIGETEDAAYYRKTRDKIIRAYREVFTDGKGNLKREFQTAYVLPLHFEMTRETASGSRSVTYSESSTEVSTKASTEASTESSTKASTKASTGSSTESSVDNSTGTSAETRQMAKNLVRLVREADNHLTTGFTGTPYLLFALSDHGYTDVAYDLLLQETCPSWLYEVKAGGTTIWERWDALRPDGSVNIGDLAGNKTEEESGGGMVSFNHYANGAVGDWLYRRIAGIEATSGGYKTFKIAPQPGGGLTSASGEIISPFGLLFSNWKIADGIFNIEIEVPVSTQCQLNMPDGSKYNLSSGKYTYKCKI